MATEQDIVDCENSLVIIDKIREDSLWNIPLVWADDPSNKARTYASLRFTKERADNLEITGAAELKCKPLTVAMADDGTYRVIMAFYKDPNAGELIMARDDKKEE